MIIRQEFFGQVVEEYNLVFFIVDINPNLI